MCTSASTNVCTSARTNVCTSARTNANVRTRPATTHWLSAGERCWPSRKCDRLWPPHSLYAYVFFTQVAQVAPSCNPWPALLYNHQSASKHGSIRLFFGSLDPNSVFIESCCPAPAACYSLMGPHTHGSARWAECRPPFTAASLCTRSVGVRACSSVAQVYPMHVHMHRCRCL